MSKIQAEVQKATSVTTKRGEDRQEYLTRLMVAIGELSDKAWEGLSKESQDWFNDAADAKNAKAKTLPDFPDLEADEEQEEPAKKSTRRGSKVEEAEAPAKPKVGVVAKITTKRGKSATGTIVEIDDEVVVIKMGDGSEQEFDRERVESIEVAGGEKDEPAEPTFKVGSQVTVTTKRGKAVTGEIVEIDDDIIVLDVDGKEQEFDRERVESIEAVGKVAKGRAGKDEPVAEDEKPARRGSKKADPEDEGESSDDKPKRSSNAAGVSVGTRIKELIAEDLKATMEQIGKQLTKEKIEFRDNTLKLQFTDCHKFIEILKANKMLKG